MDNHSVISAILEETGKAVLGKEDVLKKILTAIIAGGHILIDDIPGVGKTLSPWRSPMFWGCPTTGFSSHRMCCRQILPVFPCMIKTPDLSVMFPAQP